MQDITTSIEVKALILQAFGTLALALGGYDFEVYLYPVCSTFKQITAQLSKEPNTSPTEIEAMNEIKSSILDAYSSIIQGIRNENPSAFFPYIEAAVSLIVTVARDPKASDITRNKGLQLICDVCTLICNTTLKSLSQEDITVFIQASMKSENSVTKMNAQTAGQCLNRLKTKLLGQLYITEKVQT